MLSDHLQGGPKLIRLAPYHLTIPLVEVSGNRGSILSGDVLYRIPLPKFLGQVVGRLKLGMAAKYGIHQFSAGIAPLMGGLGKAVTGLPEQVQLKQYLLILRSFYLACSYSPPLVIASVAKQSHHAATSSYKSFHSGLKAFIIPIFFFLEPPLTCFSLLIASSMR